MNRFKGRFLIWAKRGETGVFSGLSVSREKVEGLVHHGTFLDDLGSCPMVKVLGIKNWRN